MNFHCTLKRVAVQVRVVMTNYTMGELNKLITESNLVENNVGVRGVE